jgi:chromosome segregation ATPase
MGKSKSVRSDVRDTAAIGEHQELRVQSQVNRLLNLEPDPDSTGLINLAIRRQLDGFGKESYRLHEEICGLLLTHIKDLRGREASMHEDIERLSDTCETQKESLENEQENICRLTAERECLQVELRSVAGSVQNRLQSAVQEKDQQIAVLKSTETNLKDHLTEISRKCEDTQTRAAESENRISKLEEALLDERGKINEIRAEHNRKLAKISDESWEKDLQIRDFLKNRDDLNQNIERLQQEAVAQERKTQAAEQQLLHLKIELATSQGEIEKLKTQCVYESRIRESDRSLETEILELQNETALLKQELLESQASVQKGRMQTERAVFAARSEMEQALTMRNVKFQEVETQRDNFEREAKRASQSEQRLKEDLERNAEKARQTEAGLRNEITKFQGESSVLSVQLAAAKEQLSEQRLSRSGLERDLGRSTEKLGVLRESILLHQGELQESKDSANRQMREMDANLRREIAEIESRNQNAVQELAQAKRTIADRDRKIETLENEHDERMTEFMRVKAELARSSELSTQLGIRGNQLRIYSNNLNKEKTDIEKMGKQLVQEIRLLSATHPLKDYLAATEFELSKIELQLKTTPTLSADRIKLEECLLQLIEQRDFLKTVLAGAQKQFERQANGLEKLLSRDVLSPVPPPPPTRRSARSSPTHVIPDVEGENLPNVRWEKPFEQMT